jgi:hypothetical protein
MVVPTGTIEQDALDGALTARARRGIVTERTGSGRPSTDHVVNCAQHVEDRPMNQSAHSRHLRRAVLAVGAALLLAASMPLSAGAAPPPTNGFKTQQPAMLTFGPGSPAEMTIKPIITVGDSLGGYRYEAIPDGISVLPNGRNTARVLVNHETSRVPFPYNPAAPTAANTLNDFDNAQVSELQIHRGGGVLSGQYIIDSSQNYQRFCSNYVARGDNDGFGRPIFFTNEEGIDWVFESGDAWTDTTFIENAPGARQIGAVVAYDVNNETTTTVWGMGRLNHENDVALQGFGKPVVISGDDPFVSNPAQSQVYQYIADSANDLLSDDGMLYAFVSDDANVNDYYDFGVNSGTSVSGHFIPVPKTIAVGKNPDGSDMISSEVPASVGGPYPPPPSDGTWQRGPGVTAGIDGPQWILEHWGDLNNVFQFVRIEDVAWDKRAGMSNVVYMADSGRGATSAGGNAFTSSNGRIWKMVLDKDDPTHVTSLSVLIDGDDNPVKTVAEIHQPDNLETTPNALYVLEDTGSSQQFDADQQVSDAARATTARVWQYRFSGGAMNVVAKVDQSADEGPTDEDAPTTPGRWGEWETTGIVDVSPWFGPGKFLINVQAHTLFVDVAAGPDNLAPAGADWTDKREGGQLLLLTIPGG